MMMRMSVAVASSLFVSAASTAMAQHDAPRLFTCDAAPGRFDSRLLVDLAPDKRMAGRIRMLEPRPHPTYAPGAGFLLSVPAQVGTTAGVQLGLMPDDRNNLVAGLRIPGQPGLVGIGKVPATEWIPVSALYSRGVLEVTVAGTTVRRRVRERSGWVPYLMCNSGRFEFELEPGTTYSEERFRARS